LVEPHATGADTVIDAASARCLAVFAQSGEVLGPVGMAVMGGLPQRNTTAGFWQPPFHRSSAAMAAIATSCLAYRPGSRAHHALDVSRPAL